MMHSTHPTGNEIRAFVAIELPVELRTKINLLTAQLKTRNMTAVRWVTAENIHLTLKFLGNISQMTMDRLIPMLRPVGAAQTPFEINVAGIGAFPNPRRPRVIWVGLHAPENLVLLQAAVENAAAEVGVAPEERGFSPHLTIGRVRQEATGVEIDSIAEGIRQLKFDPIGTISATEFSLIRSDLRPEGPRYSILANFTFRNAR